MTGQIPPYGNWLRRVRLNIHPSLSGTVYVLKQDPTWFIRSDKTSHRWWVFHAEIGQHYDGGMIVSPVKRTLTEARDTLVLGMQQQFYDVR